MCKIFPSTATFLAAAAVVLLAGCGREQSDAPLTTPDMPLVPLPAPASAPDTLVPDADETIVRVATSGWFGQAASWVGHGMGVFRKSGFKVELESRDSSAERLELLATGLVHAAIVDEVAMLLRMQQAKTQEFYWVGCPATYSQAAAPLADVFAPEPVPAQLQNRTGTAVLLLTREWVDADLERARRLVAGYNDAVRLLLDDPRNCAARIRRYSYSKESKEAIQRSLEAITWMSASAQRAFMTDEQHFAETDRLCSLLHEELCLITAVPQFREWVRLDLLPE